MSALFDLHHARLDAALDARRRRGFWAGFADTPDDAAYPMAAARDGARAWQSRLGRPFGLAQARDQGRGGGEVSPYGFPLGIDYPSASPSQWLERAERAGRGWARVEVTTRTGIALEALARLNRQSFEMAQAMMHTTGQPWLMAFQSGGPHAQDRALMAIAATYEALRRVPSGRAAHTGGTTWRVASAGTALVLGSALSPNWAAYPGLFASLVAGNPALIRPHPRAILPLALTVDTLRSVLAEAGLDPDIVQLCVDGEATGSARTLATAPTIGLIDHAGDHAFTAWLAAHARGARLFTETQGLSPAVIDGTEDLEGLCRDLAYRLVLHAGQTRAAPRLIFLPAEGVPTGRGHCRFDDLAASLAAAIDDVLADPADAAAILGALADPGALARIERCRPLGRVVREPGPVSLAGHPRARTSSPMLVAMEGGAEEGAFDLEPGPVACLVATHDTAESIERAAHVAATRNAVGAIVQSADDQVLETAADAFVARGVAVTCNPSMDVASELGRHERDWTWPTPGFASSRFRVVAVNGRG